MITFYQAIQINEAVQIRHYRPAPPAYPQYNDDDVVIVREYDDGFEAVVRVDGQELTVYYAPCRSR